MSLDPGEPQRKLRGSYPGAKTRPTRTLAAGDMVGSLEVVAAPGHTPGHVAFFDRRDGTLLCGDAYTTLGGVATTDKVRLPFPLASMATWDPATELESARALRALEPAALAPGPRAASSRRRRPRWTPRSPRRPPSRCRARGSTPSAWSTPRRAIADAEGLDAVTLARVAGGLGVRAPSLYNHVDGRAGLLRALALRGVRELTAALRDAAVGRVGRRRARRHRARLPRLRARPSRALRRQRGRAGARRRRAPGGRGGDRRRRLRRAARLVARGRRRGPRRARLPQRRPRLRGARGGGRLRDPGRPRHVLRAPRRDAGRRPRYRSMTARSPRRRASASATTRRWQWAGSASRHSSAVGGAPASSAASASSSSAGGGVEVAAEAVRGLGEPAGAVEEAQVRRRAQRRGGVS